MTNYAYIAIWYDERQYDTVQFCIGWNTLQSIMITCMMTYDGIRYIMIWQHTARHSMIGYDMTRYNTTQHRAYNTYAQIWCVQIQSIIAKGALKCDTSTIWCDMMWYNATWYMTIRYHLRYDNMVHYDMMSNEAMIGWDVISYITLWSNMIQLDALRCGTIR